VSRIVVLSFLNAPNKQENNNSSNKNTATNQHKHTWKSERPRLAIKDVDKTNSFLPRRITIVARIGRRIDQTSSDEGL